MFPLPAKTLGTQGPCTNHNNCQNTWLWLMCHGVWNFSTTVHTGAVNRALVCCTDKINIFCGVWKACELNWMNWTGWTELNWGTWPSAMKWTEWTGNWPDQAGNLNCTNPFRWFWTEFVSFWHYSTPWTSKQAQPSKHTIPPLRQWTLGWWAGFSPGGT